MTSLRYQRLLDLMHANGADCAVINPGATLTYLTGLHFHLMERPTLLICKAGQQPVLVLPALELGKANSSLLPLKTFSFGDDPAAWPGVIQLALNSLGLEKGKVLVEPTRLRFMEIDFVQKAAPGLQFANGDAVFNNLRLQKDAGEIKAMRKAVEIAQTALAATLPVLRPGITEIEVASHLTIEMLKGGSATELPFQPIVAAGPNSANPHAVPTDRKLQNGDLVVIDWGAAYEDYYSDLTRTFAIGSISDELRRVYNTVKAANEAGRKVGQPEVEAGDVDRAARQVIEAAGYGAYFTHRTGHGLGMEAHEPPYMFGANTLPLNVGMVYTVEPGIYLPGVGGVRIEDNIVVTAQGCESLSDFPRELQILS
jgi:Xaa-Pro dipeptidase